jgi:hypothetical protein
MADARVAEYDELAAAASAAGDLSASARVTALRRLRKQWRQINRRDFFPPPQRERARAALQWLAKAAEQVPGDEAEEVSR